MLRSTQLYCLQLEVASSRVELAAELLVRRADPDLSGYTFQLVVVAAARFAASHTFHLSIRMWPSHLIASHRIASHLLILIRVCGFMTIVTRHYTYA